MVIRASQLIDKVYLDLVRSEDFIGFLGESMRRELVNKLADRLADHNLYIVQLSEPESVNDLTTMQVEYRQDLDCNKIVQCKNCRMHFAWCQKFKDELGGDGFCPYGKEPEEIEKKEQRYEISNSTK